MILNYWLITIKNHPCTHCSLHALHHAMHGHSSNHPYGFLPFQQGVSISKHFLLYNIPSDTSFLRRIQKLQRFNETISCSASCKRLQRIRTLMCTRPVRIMPIFRTKQHASLHTVRTCHCFVARPSSTRYIYGAVTKRLRTTI